VRCESLSSLMVKFHYHRRYHLSTIIIIIIIDCRSRRIIDCRSTLLLFFHRFSK
jgi:hypothetical protein